MNVLVTVLFLFVLNDAAWLPPGLRGDMPPWGPVAPPPWSASPPSAVFRRPMDAMVDLTNDLGVAILQEYSHSRSNFAFSPYGLASVLVVLYEGAKGESARQIHVSGRFPWDRDITRIGFRDIHRHLRSYFSHEGYLSGITLNKEKSSLNSDYKRVLRFYGYDVDLDAPKSTTQRPLQKIPTVTRPSKPKESSTLGLPSRENDVTLPSVSDKPVTTEFFEPVTLKPIVSSSTDKMIDLTTKISEIATTHVTNRSETTTNVPVTLSTHVPEGTTKIEEVIAERSKGFVESVETTTDFTATTDDFGSTTFTEIPVVPTTFESVFETTTVERDVDTMSPAITEITDNGMLVPQPTVKGTDDAGDDDEGRENVDGLETTTARLKEEEEKVIKRSPAAVLASNPVQPAHKFVLPADEPFTPKTLDEFLMAKQQLTDFLPKTLDELFLSVQFGTNVGFKESSRRRRRTIADMLHLPAVPDLSLQLQNGMFDSHVSRKAELYRPLPRREFLVDAVSETPVPVMTYTNVFPFAYIPRLHSTALEFPLDDERYKLLMILPMERRGLRQLTYDLSSVTLRGVLEALRPSRVKATVPTFMVEGFVILTPALQRLGIWDLFEPRRANLTGMSSDPELYVRNVEQSVTVVIRNYVEILDIQTRTMAARGVEHEFVATHPFLYFVLDTETNVSLMAGQMLDPLNSRVY